ncbi:MAG: TadE/TadG family type IV pilus assembly protein, partial [Myxococcota bacterium]
MKMFRRMCRRIRQDEAGGAVVETALIVPIFVVLVYWSALFYDIVQLRFKVQEAARFAAWEMTSYPLSDYMTGEPETAMTSAVTRARARTDRLYTSLHSEDEHEGSHPRLMVTYEYGESEFWNDEVELAGPGADALSEMIDGEMQTVVSNLLGYVDDALGWMIDWLHLNTHGLVTAEVTATVQPQIIPQRLLQAEDGGFYRNKIIEATEYPLMGRASLIADGWTLHFGNSTKPETGYEDNPYHRQVQRGHMLGLLENTGVGKVVDAIDEMRSLLDSVVEVPLFTDAHLASMNYYGDEGGAMKTRNQLRLEVSSDSRQKHFHSQPLQEVCPPS